MAGTARAHDPSESAPFTRRSRAAISLQSGPTAAPCSAPTHSARPAPLSLSFTLKIDDDDATKQGIALDIMAVLSV